MPGQDVSARACVVRRAGDGDVATVLPLFLAYLRFYGVPADADRASDFLQARIARGESAVFVAEDGGEALGFAQLYPGFSSLEQRRQWVLEDLYVVPDARRRGVGAALLGAAERLGRDTGAIRLTLATAIDNRTAQALYESHGWRRDDAFYVYARGLDSD